MIRRVCRERFRLRPGREPTAFTPVASLTVLHVSSIRQRYGKHLRNIFSSGPDSQDCLVVRPGTNVVDFNMSAAGLHFDPA